MAVKSISLTQRQYGKFLRLPDGRTLIGRRLRNLEKSALSGAGIFELIQIRSISDVGRFIELVSDNGELLMTPNSSHANTSLTYQQVSSLVDCKALAAFQEMLLHETISVQKHLSQSSDAAIAYELDRISSGKHSQPGYLSKAGPHMKRMDESYPMERHPKYFYRLLRMLLSNPCINSFSSITDSDIGIVRTACNSLIFDRKITDPACMLERVNMSGGHPDGSCFDYDTGDMYVLPSWPDWADTASWWDNLAPLSDLHFDDWSDHYGRVEERPERFKSAVVVLMNREPSPRRKLHPAYRWHWHRGNLFVGFLKDATQEVKELVLDVAKELDMIPASSAS